MALTSQIRHVEVLDTSVTTGAGLTGKAHSDFTAAYCVDGGTLVSLTTETIATLGTYQAPTLSDHIRIKELNSADPTKGMYEVHFHNSQLSSGTRLWLYLSVTGGKAQRLELDLVDVKPVNLTQIGGNAQSATDLKDFADTGYDPVTHKVGGVVLVDTTTTNSDMRGTDSAALATDMAKVPKSDGTVAFNATAVGGIQSGLATSANVTSILNAISGLNNLSALANLYGPPLLEIPDSGDPDAVYAFTLVVRDNEGKLVALDGSPTIAAANAAGTDRSTNLSAVSNPATGRYTFTYSVADDATPESLRITCSGTVSAEARYVEWVGAVVDYDTLTTLLAVKAKTDNLPADPASASTVASAFDALQDISTADILTALGTAGGLDAALALLATASTLNLVKAKTDLIPASPAAVGDIPTLSQIFTTMLTQSYRATGAAPTLAQFVFEVLGHLTNSDIVDTLKTIYKLDKTTPAKTATLTIDGSGNPTAIEETT